MFRNAVVLAAVAFASTANAAPATECDVCHLHYFHKDVSSKTAFGADVKHCREYAHESCCTADVAKGVADAQNKYLYPGYNQQGCGKLSDKCQQYFREESCFYECDRNMGKWRKHTSCKDAKNQSNGWQIESMPIKASYCNGWFDACKDDMFCEGKTRAFFDLPTCNTTTSCKKFSDIYKDGKEVCEVMWSGSFKYETNETKAYTMTFKEGEANPNNKVFPDKKYPPMCDDSPVNVTHPDGDDATSQGCDANWHHDSDSGHKMAGTKPPAPTSSAAAFTVAAVFAAVVALAF